MTLLTLRGYAKSRRVRGLPGGSLAAVQKAVESGRIELVDGKVDLETADAAWLANTSTVQQERGASGGARSARSTDADVDGPKGYLVARARRESAAADLAEMEAAEARGEMVRVEDVIRCWGEMVTALRARLLVLPSLAAPRVAPAGKAREAQAVLMKLVHEALSELSDGVPEKTARRARRHAANTETAA